MKKVKKPNLRKMFNFHTIILVLLVLVVSNLHTHTSEGKLQRLHKHQCHNNNYKNHNAVGFAKAADDNDDAADKQTHTHSHSHNHNNHYHQSHHHHRHHYDGTTPSLEFTTSSSSASSGAAVSSDNELLIKQQQEQPLTNQYDEIHYKTEEDLHASAASSATSSTTSNPLLSMQATNNNKEKVNFLRTIKSSLYSTSTHAETLANSMREHTHHSHNNRLISTPLTTPEGNSDDAIDNNPIAGNFTTMYAKGIDHQLNNSNWNLATKAKDTIPLQSQTRNDEKPEFSNEHQRSQQNNEDYYADDDVDADDDSDNDDDYGEDEGDNDGISYDDDNNLSDRSYARITRSKLDDDYIDDEPYRNGINEFSMQRDAAPGVLTEQKYMDVGNEKAVQQARERYIQEQKRPRTPHELATEHWHRMIQATKCRKPLPRVIPVSNNTSKRYEPYATILHRCGDDTGCCGSTASVCTVKRHEIVLVYVFSYDFNYRKEIEALPMQNHTECHCVNRGSLLHDSMPRDKRSGGGSGSSSSSYLHHFQRQQRRLQQQQQHQQRDSDSQPYPQLQVHHQQQLQNTLDCHCPRHFNVFEEDVERHVHLPKPHSVFIRKCRCDCLVNNQTCLRFKHGEEGFSLEDRKCILERDCKPPVCLHGEYNSRVGRCPSYRSHFLQTT